MSENISPGNMMDTESKGLKKHKLSVFTVVFMIFSLVAAGCYGIEDMIPSTGPGLTIIILIVLPFVWGVPFGLVASELGSVRPQEGGYYKWVQEALGEFWGFLAGWWRTVSIYVDNTLYVVLAVGYLATEFKMTWYVEFAFKALMILIFMIVNLKGVKDVGIITNVLSIFVIIAFAMIAIIGFMNWGGNPLEPVTAWETEGAVDWILLLGGGLSIGMWMYSGYESMSTIAGELEDPQVIPKATLITVPIIMATYIIPTAAALSAFKTEGADFGFENWSSEGGGIGYASLAEHFVGPAAGIFFVVVAVIAQCSIFNTYIASGSRGFFTLSEDKLAPKIFGKVGKKNGVPYVSVLSVGIVSLILCMIPFKNLVVIDVFLLISSYILVYVSAMVLRRRIPREEYKFRVPGGNGFMTVVCIVPIIVAFLSFFINGTDYFIGGMIGIISGPVLYFFWKRRYGGLTVLENGLNPQNPKTKLASGDLNRMAVMFAILAVIGAIGSLFLPWYETAGEWVFPDDYDMTIMGSQGAMWLGIKIATAVSAVLAIVLWLAGKKVEVKTVA